jgi:amidase
MTRRDTLKLGTNAALSSAAVPLFASQGAATADEVCFMPAVDMIEAIRKKKISAREVMEAHLKQIKRVNPKVNAMVTLAPEEQLMAQASEANENSIYGTI